MKVSNSSMQRTVEAYLEVRQELRIEAEMETVRAIEHGGAGLEEQPARSLRPRERRWRVNLRWLMGGMLGAGLLAAVLRSLIEPEKLLWLAAIQSPLPVRGNLSDILAPLLAVSVAIERLLETAFDAFEQSTRSAADVLKTPAELLDWIGREYQQAYLAAAEAAEAVRLKATPMAMRKLEEAEERLSQAESRLRSWVEAPEYKAWKRALTIWVGLLAGLLVAIGGDLGMLRLMGMPAPRLIDLLITGLVIGAGPGPMHALIGILQSGKTAVDNLAELAKGKAMLAAAQSVHSAAEKDNR